MSSAPSTQTGGRAASAASSRLGRGFKKTFVFGSEWRFLPEGLKSLQQRFNKVLESKELDALLEWNEGDATFRISCLHPISDQVWGLFFKTVQEFIAQESGCDLDGSDDETYVGESDDDSIDSDLAAVTSNKIQLLVKWKQEIVITEKLPESDEVCDGSLQLTLAFESPEQIQSYPRKIIWDYEDTNQALDEIFSDRLLAKLEALVSCSFVKDIIQSKIYIGANSEEECARAVCKLDNIRKNSIVRYNYMKHLFYTEEDENFQISFKHLPDVKKKFFETTLLDNLQLSASTFNYRNLPLAVTVRCNVFNAIKARYIPFKIAKYRPAVVFGEADPDLREWEDWKYNHYIPQGEADENTMTRFESYAVQKTLRSGTKEIKTESQPHTSEEPSGPPICTSDSSHATETQRWVLGQDKTSSSVDVLGQLEHKTSNSTREQEPEPEQYASWDTYRPYSAERYGRQHNKTRVAQSSKVDMKASTPQPASFSIIDEDVFLIGMPVLNPIRNGVEPSTSLCVPTSEPFRTVTNNSNLGSNAALLPLHDAPEQLASDSMAMLPRDPFGSPVRVLDSHPVIRLEAMQPVDEVATRDFHSMMNQQVTKPNQNIKTKRTKGHSFASRLESPSPPPILRRVPEAPAYITEPTRQFITDFDLGFDELLQGLRGFQGELNIQAEFGRVLLKGIHRKFITREDSDSGIDPETALEVMENPDGSPKTVFTKILTVLPADISYLVEMKDRQGRYMWVHDNPNNWKVVYEILCVDARKPNHRSFTIEIDSESFSCQVKTRRNFGAINVHGVKRHWDFRVSATGFELEDEIDLAYKDFAKIVKESLHIPKGVTNPVLYFQVPHSLNHFTVFGVRVRRISQYGSQNTKSMLNVSEVRELQLDYIEDTGSMIWKALGSNRPSTLLVQQGQTYKWIYLWHEVSISCPKADEMFEQNKSIELGENASWDYKKLQEVNAAQSLYLPACEMLRQMDGVGFHNDNEIGAEAIRSCAATEPEAEAEYFFW